MVGANHTSQLLLCTTLHQEGEKLPRVSPAYPLLGKLSSQRWFVGIQVRFLRAVRLGMSGLVQDDVMCVSRSSEVEMKSL